MTAEKIRRLKCACCGGEAGHWQQWHNQDTGWGLCRTCADWIMSQPSTRTYHNELASPLQFCRTYGLPGKNYEPRYQRHCGLDFAIVASFPNRVKGTSDANEFMALFRGTSVLGIFGDQIILAMKDDIGRKPVEPESQA
ncbi:hypothetical protein [Hydrogenophaga sp. NFH-34]|uniref:hypothetical protein n=1 Tax=Hydrogenophaga sp. NFH-34 TaxID=2744446 RepID=UPI001F2B728D|nr:hypothetical protein [Hydrogenophaga sp. NFH-34]